MFGGPLSAISLGRSLLQIQFVHAACLSPKAVSFNTIGDLHKLDEPRGLRSNSCQNWIVQTDTMWVDDL